MSGGREQGQREREAAASPQAVSADDPALSPPEHEHDHEHAEAEIRESLRKLARTVDGLKLLAVGSWPFPRVPIESNWNGEGAAEITAETIDRAYRIYNRYIPRYGACSTVVARPDGSLSVIWHGLKCYRQVDVRPDGAIQWTECNTGSGVRRWLEGCEDTSEQGCDEASGPA